MDGMDGKITVKSLAELTIRINNKSKLVMKRKWMIKEMTFTKNCNRQS